MSEETKQIMDFLKDFRNEFVEFKTEMIGFKGDMLGFKEEMNEFKGEMLGFKDEVTSRLDNHEQLLNQLTDSVKVLNSEVREIKANQMNFDEKLTNLIGVDSSQQSDIDLAFDKILQNERKIAKMEKLLQT